MKLVVVDQNGREYTLDGTEGWSVMEVVRGDSRLSLKAECGGCVSCATCHVYVDPAWKAKVPPADELEISMLDMAFEVSDDSRLSCQIKLEPGLDGLKVTLAPGTD